MHTVKTDAETTESKLLNKQFQARKGDPVVWALLNIKLSCTLPTLCLTFIYCKYSNCTCVCALIMLQQLHSQEPELLLLMSLLYKLLPAESEWWHNKRQRDKREDFNVACVDNETDSKHQKTKTQWRVWCQSEIFLFACCCLSPEVLFQMNVPII